MVSMRDTTQPYVDPRDLESANRRHDPDRRGEANDGRRGNAARQNSRVFKIGRDVFIVVAALVVIVFTVHRVHPIFANQPKVAASLTKEIPAAKAVLSRPQPPLDTSRLAQVLRSPKFEADRRAFSADLMKTGRMTQARADSIAYYAVREAYVNGIPPAVVFGVMLTENAQFVSRAMSNVGAVGLMQVYPRIWLKELKDRFGSDLASDSTNLKYGIYILKKYVKSDSGKVTAYNLSKGLLHYNGCVRGTNTPNCRTYPAKVKGYVETQGGSICAAHDFYDCIAKPFIAGLLGKSSDTD
jgi:soluble lytic murein transglycosylase-like protein